MRRPISRVSVITLAVCLCAGWAYAQDTGILREHHPWGRFRPGAWKQVRVVTETLDDAGLVKSTSTVETKTTLSRIEDSSVTLELDVVHEVAGKRFIAPPTTIKQGFDGEVICPGVKSKDLGPGEITIDDNKIACRILEVTCPGPTSKIVSRLFYCRDAAPYIMKRESVTTDLEGKSRLGDLAVSVQHLGTSCIFQGIPMKTAQVEAIQRHSKGRTLTRFTVSSDVPGGVVSHESWEYDQSGRLVRRGTLELVSYGLEPEPERAGLLGRHRRAVRAKSKAAARHALRQD